MLDIALPPPQIYFSGNETTFEQFESFIQNLISKYSAPKSLIFSSASTFSFQGPLIFLDFDGVCWPFQENVIHPKFEKLKGDPRLNDLLKKYSTFLQHHYDFREGDKDFLKVACWDPTCMVHISNLCKKYKAKIVVSSNWRRERTVSHLQNLLDLWGLGSYVIGKTKDGNHAARDTRAKQIQEWMTDNQYTSSEFVILDDGYIEELEQQFPNNFVHCNLLIGVDDKACGKAESVLQKGALNAQESILQDCSINTLTRLFATLTP